MSWFSVRTTTRPLILAEPTISTADANTAHVWRLTLTEWNDLTEQGRSWHREHHTKAPGFTNTTGTP